MCGRYVVAEVSAGLTARLGAGRVVVENLLFSWAGAEVQRARFAAGFGWRAEDASA